MHMNNDRTWLGIEIEYEGFPILFRRPDIAMKEYDYLSQRFPYLLVIEHKLSEVAENGLPIKKYNDSLEFLDLKISSITEKQGIVFLIETLAGKRTYYIYITNTEFGNGYGSTIKSQFPSENLSWEVESDKKWKLAHGYTRDFKFA